MSNFLGIRTWGRKMHTFGTNMYIKTPVDFCEWLTIRAAATWKTPTRSYPKTLLTHGQTFAAAGLTLLRKIATRFTSLKSNPAHAARHLGKLLTTRIFSKRNATRKNRSIRLY